MKYPRWVGLLPVRQQPAGRLTFHMRTMAARHNQRASVVELACAIGYSESSIREAMNRGQLTRGMAAAIEKELGSEHFPREELTAQGLIK